MDRTARRFDIHSEARRQERADDPTFQNYSKLVKARIVAGCVWSAKTRAKSVHVQASGLRKAGILLRALRPFREIYRDAFKDIPERRFGRFPLGCTEWAEQAPSVNVIFLATSEIAPVAPRFTRERTVASVQCRDRRKGKRHCRQSVYCVSDAEQHMPFLCGRLDNTQGKRGDP